MHVEIDMYRIIWLAPVEASLLRSNLIDAANSREEAFIFNTLFRPLNLNTKIVAIARHPGLFSF